MALAVVGAQTERTLDSFYMDAQARVNEFFHVWSSDLVGDDAQSALKIGAEFIRVHARTRFSTFFKLQASVVEQVILENGGGTGWRQTIEELAGFQFEGRSAPASADLLRTESNESVRPAKKLKTDACKHDSHPNANTISAQLNESGELMGHPLPDHVFSVITTPNPLVNEIKESDLEAFTDSVLAHCSRTFARFNIGRPLARIWGAQAHARLKKLPNYGSVAGEDRSIGNMLYEKSKNRSHVRCRPAPPARPCVCASPRCLPAAMRRHISQCCMRLLLPCARAHRRSTRSPWS